uniref:Protein V2 n=1 Tax=Hibiscus rosa-sinensis mosaic virus TaxID=329256 RepID=Q4U0F6_9GEMI|nr:pre-coat protein [Hibiscus rosa-sinensis mosaic virus]
MWDPLVNELPGTIHGLRCMLTNKYLQLVKNTYSEDTKGYELISDLICINRVRDYGEATRRYSDFYTCVEGTPEAELRQPVHYTCCCPHCPRHKAKTGLDLQAHEQKAHDVPPVQKP